MKAHSIWTAQIGSMSNDDSDCSFINHTGDFHNQLWVISAQFLYYVTQTISLFQSVKE